MSAICVEATDTPFQVQLPGDLFKSPEAFRQLCQANRELRIEKDQFGNILVMAPTGSEAGSKNASLTAQLYTWAKRDGTGIAFDSSTGFELPNGATRSPDASWVARKRWDRLSPDQRKRFAPLCPDFVAELRSEQDRLQTLEAKLAEYLEHGTKLGILIDPVEHRISVYRPNRPPEVLVAPRQFSADPELKGFVLDLSDIL